LNAIEHNTRYTMMYVGERADGGILGVLFKINEEIAWGTQTKATERLRDLFLDWSGPMLAATLDLVTLGQTSAACLENLRDYANSGSARSITVNVTAAGLTTAEAARALGNQIAQNLAS